MRDAPLRSSTRRCAHRLTTKRYDVEVRAGRVDDATPDAPAATPWPDDVRAALTATR